tara:strand:- start:1 stop:1128 length:1128 start_codon:yes stop_codon:yes gene_type:complete
MGKQVKTPRFYVDIPTFLHATGDIDWGISSVGGAELLYMNCANPYVRKNTNAGDWIFRIGDFGKISKTAFPINFCALLNHNLASEVVAENLFTVSGIHAIMNEPSDYDSISISSVIKDEILNANSIGGLQPKYNGTSIWTLNEQESKYWHFFGIKYEDGYDENHPHQLGSFVVGKYFDCPNSPDLNVTMSRRFDGIKKQKTIGGKQLANIYYDGPTEWTMNRKIADFNGFETYKYPPFELDTTAKVDSEGYRYDFRAKSGLGRKGLRSWNLTFSYISESDMWINSEVSSKIINDEVEDGQIPTTGIDENPMLSDNSFNFVYNCTLGGALPFIFTDDKDSNAPDRYSICTFRENTFKVTQVAFNTYNVSMTIDEIA